MRNVVALVAAVWLVASAPAAAYACPSCFAGVGASQMFFITFILMTLLPLVTMGTIVYWLVRRAKRMEETRHLEQVEHIELEPVVDPAE